MTKAEKGTALFFLAAPAIVSGVVPWWITHWHFEPPFFGLEGLRIVGVALILCALPVLLDSFLRFAREGLGTPAPVAPTEHLVVSGWYRFVRNPMYVAVVSIVGGQALLFASPVLVFYALCLWLAFHCFVIFYEERVLRKRYGPEYDRFVRTVPRWIPRLRL